MQAYLIEVDRLAILKPKLLDQLFRLLALLLVAIDDFL